MMTCPVCERKQKQRNEFEKKKFLPREVWGLQLASLTQKEIFILKDLLAKYGFLVFKGKSQNEMMTTNSMELLMNSLCLKNVHSFPLDFTKKRKSKIRALGNVNNAIFCRTGLEWHSDGVGMNTILVCFSTPEVGGDTLFASSTGMFERLEEDQKVEMMQATARYSNRFTSGGYSAIDFEHGLRMNNTGTKLLKSASTKMKSWRHWHREMPLVFENAHGQHFISVDTRKLDHILGMSVEDSRNKLQEWLLKGLGRCDCVEKNNLQMRHNKVLDDDDDVDEWNPEYVYRHKWQVGDVILFDNDSVLHSPTATDSYENSSIRLTPVPSRYTSVSTARQFVST